VPPGSATAIASALADEVRSLGGGEVFHCDASQDHRALARELKSRRGATIVVTGLENAGWPTLDLARSQFEGAAEVVVVAASDKGLRFLSDAPHLASWFGPNIWLADLAADDSDEQRRESARLAVLRERFCMTDAQVIEGAEKRTLPLEPEIVEWLVLLRRGDLLGT
jgi:hypothetical protein